MGNLLNNIESPADIKALNDDELLALCDEVRQTLIHSVSKTGGHLASNLGVVELTVALHRVFHSPDDAILFDVGHQCYTHKLLTGRREAFSTLRQEGGLSGFPRPAESPHDAYIAGHSSASLSAALGMAQAMRLRGEPGYAIAVIGDGAMTGGLAFEAMNNAGRTREKLIVILNDNKMSISRNVGSMPRLLSRMRAKRRYVRFKKVIEQGARGIPLIGNAVRNLLHNIKQLVKAVLVRSNLFEDMGFRYLGPIDGHRLFDLMDALEAAREMQSPVVLHVRTVKGKGYSFAEKKPNDYHGVSAFDIDSGEGSQPGENYSARMGQTLCRLAAANPRLCAVTAAMAEGTGLIPFATGYKSRFFDVGIAEQHAVTFCGGLSQKGLLPVFAVYSSFLQRGFDQVLHDLAIMHCDVILAIDRAGVVGEDGETHQGVFDVAFLSCIPGVTIYSPASFAELDDTLTRLCRGGCGVCAVRYPRGGETALPECFQWQSAENSSTMPPHTLYAPRPADRLVVGYGREFCHIAMAADRLPADQAVHVLKLNQLAPLSEETVALAAAYRQIYFFEEGIKQGGVAEHFGAMLLERGYAGRYRITAIDNAFVPQASVSRALDKLDLSPEGILRVLAG